MQGFIVPVTKVIAGVLAFALGLEVQWASPTDPTEVCC